MARMVSEPGAWCKDYRTEGSEENKDAIENRKGFSRTGKHHGREGRFLEHLLPSQLRNVK
jgi:hypothetical protein